MNALRISLALWISLAVTGCPSPQSAPRARHSVDAQHPPAPPTPAPGPVPTAAPPTTPAPTAAPPPEGLAERIAGDANPDEPLPLVIALHGLGDAPEDFVMLFQTLNSRARVVALRAFDSWQGGASWFAPGLDPASPAFARAVETSARRVADEVRAVAASRPTCGDIVITGFSQGAMLSYTLAAIEPTLAARFVPIAGRLGVATTIAASARSGDVRALHGGADRRVPVADGRTAVARLRAAGRDAQFQEFAGADHAITLPMREALFAAVREITDRGCPSAH